MRNLTRPLAASSLDVQVVKWKRRRDIPLAFLAWTGVVAVILWGASHIIRAILLLAIAALFAYALAPVVKLLERLLPRALAILIVYLVFLTLISVFFYIMVNTAIEQTFSLTRQVRILLSPGPNGELSPLEQIVGRFGITPEQIVAARQQIIMQGEGFAKDSFPLLRSVLDFALDTIVVAVMSIYLLLDGARAANWIRTNAPQVARANFFVDTLQRVVGGYIRGQFTLAALIGLLVGLGMGLIFHLPYAVFLGVLAFAVAFIPVLGTFVSGALCVLIALPQGWLIAGGVLVYFVIIHVIEGEVVGPRIVGQSIGLHPVVSLFALIAGAELFGLWGALFASPIAGVLQAVIITFWQEWRQSHPEQFEEVKEEALEPLPQPEDRRETLS